MDTTRTLLEEDNVVSLRTAIVLDDGNLVSFRLMPAWLGSSIPGAQEKSFDWVDTDSTYLYRHQRSASGEEELVFGNYAVERGVKPMVFEKPPELELLWSDSGNSVALLLNGEPWAFIHEVTRQGYSKGVLKLKIGNLWNQELFEKTFVGP